jgi:Family of unknown function (DUF6165)
MSHIMAPVSAGELFDKISILRIKSERFADPGKLANVRSELALLEAIAGMVTVTDRTALEQLEADLRRVNEEIWEAEDIVRSYDRVGRFGEDYVAVSRRTYGNNDRRSAIKRAINALLGSSIVEEKGHALREV